MNKIIRMSEQGGNLSKNNPLFVYDEQIEKVWPHHQTVPVIEFRCFGELCTPPDTNLEIPPPILHVWLNAPKHMHGHGHLPSYLSHTHPATPATWLHIYLSVISSPELSTAQTYLIYCLLLCFNKISVRYVMSNILIN